MPDLLIINGQVIDGSGSPGFYAAVSVVIDRGANTGALPGRDRRRVHGTT